MTELILHHYDGSPFSEKVRLVLGFKGLAWKSVKVPVMMPKPDVVALTGGYRRAPVMQIGADIYCDSALVCRVIDESAPQPALYPAAAGGMQHVLAQWADSALIWSALTYTMQPAGIGHIFGDAPPEYLKAFAADRAAMTAGMRRPTRADATAQLHSYLAWLEADLADERSFLRGAQPCIADFSVAQSLWFMRRAPPVAGVLEAYRRLLAWYERIVEFGHGRPDKIASSEALAVAAAATTHEAASLDLAQGFEVGSEVTVTPTDYAMDPVAGKLIGLNAHEAVVERSDERAGTLHVHFPRIGYQVRKASTENQR